MFDNIFQVVSGTVVGRDHVHDGRNNQDAFHVLEDSSLFVAVVCDGCGDSSHSEVGALIGSRLVASAVARYTKMLPESSYMHLAASEFWERIRQDVMAQIRVLAHQMGESLSEVITKHFLFTIVGTLITQKISIFFCLGDGTMFVNGERFHIGPYPNNAPPYLSYGLVETTQDYDAEDLRFRIPLVIPTDQLESFLIGTDGVEDIINAEHKTLPGKEEAIETIDLLWSDSRYFRNRSLLQRRLNLMNAEARIPDWDRKAIDRHMGLLHDDTTLVVARRLRSEE